MDPAGPVGILGGSFDPIHRGHLQLAHDAREQLGLAEVRLLPAGQPWQKQGLSPAAQRARMVALAIEDEPGLVLDTREIDRPGPSYTIDTLRELRAELGPSRPLVLILGGDQWANLASWRQWQSLAEFAHLAVAMRNAEPLATSPEVAAWAAPRQMAAGQIAARPAGGITGFSMLPVACSATELRQKLASTPSPARDAQLASALKPAVLHYIRAQTLYRNPHGHQETAARRG